MCFLLFAAGNITVAKNADDNLDFSFMRVASEVLDVISKPFFDKNSVILLNAGLHYLESTNFSNYQKTIGSLIRLFQETKMVTTANGNLLFPGEMIWRTTTALNKQKLDGKHIQARRFLTYQVCSVLSEIFPTVNSAKRGSTFNANAKLSYTFVLLYSNEYKIHTRRLA